MAKKQKAPKAPAALDATKPSDVQPGETTGPVGPDVTPITYPLPPVGGSKVPGVLDSQLHPELHEAHRVLTVGKDAFQKVIDQCEGQYVRPLLNAHDGDSSTCEDIKAQIAAFRGLYR